MFVDCMHRVPSRCCYFAYKHSTKCNSVSPNVRVWDAASSGTKCNAIQMRPNVARRFSDFATNSRAMTSMSVLYNSRSLCTCRTARWYSRSDSLSCASSLCFKATQWWEAAFDQKLRNTNTLLVPQPKSWGGGTCLPWSPWLLRLWSCHPYNTVKITLLIGTFNWNICSWMQWYKGFIDIQLASVSRKH